MDLDEIRSHPFRAKFRLLPGSRDRSIAMVRGPTAMRAHAIDIVGKRLAPAAPYNDGRQTQQHYVVGVICDWIAKELG